MAKKFFQLPRLVQIILLILPIVGWIVELVIRWSAVLEKFTLLNLIAALVYTSLILSGLFFSNIYSLPKLNYIFKKEINNNALVD